MTKLLFNNSEFILLYISEFAAKSLTKLSEATKLAPVKSAGKSTVIPITGQYFAVLLLIMILVEDKVFSW